MWGVYGGARDGEWGGVEGGRVAMVLAGGRGRDNASVDASNSRRNMG